MPRDGSPSCEHPGVTAQGPLRLNSSRRALAGRIDKPHHVRDAGPSSNRSRAKAPPTCCARFRPVQSRPAAIRPWEGGPSDGAARFGTRTRGHVPSAALVTSPADQPRPSEGTERCSGQFSSSPSSSSSSWPSSAAGASRAETEPRAEAAAGVPVAASVRACTCWLSRRGGDQRARGGSSA